MSISVSPYNPVQQSGSRAKNPPDLVIASRAPTTSDYGFFLGTLWLFEGTGMYTLVTISITPSAKSATWISLGASAGLFTSLTVNGASALNGNTTITGNLGLTGVASKLSINASAPSTASVGLTSAMIAGAVTVTSSAVTTASIILYSRKSLGTAMGNVSITAQSNGAFTLTSDAGTETSTFNYQIIN